MSGGRTLDRETARRFYDRVGAKQDSQGFYEQPALDRLIAHADFEHAHSVAEFGCGTGRFASELLQHRLPADARYWGVDLSPRMVDIAARRVEPFGDRATVERTEGEPRLPQPDGWGDRVVSTYVLDLLSDEDIRIVLGEAHRVLRPGGMLCVVGITPGEAGLSRLLMNLWQRIHALKPILVGGCRPLRVADYLDQQQWQPLHHSVVTAWGVSSEVTVARRNDA